MGRRTCTDLPPGVHGEAAGVTSVPSLPDQKSCGGFWSKRVWLLITTFIRATSSDRHWQGGETKMGQEPTVKKEKGKNKATFCRGVIIFIQCIHTLRLPLCLRAHTCCRNLNWLKRKVVRVAVQRGYIYTWKAPPITDVYIHCILATHSGFQNCFKFTK